MPEDMDTIDIHRGTDVEFGQSIYEPFGIAPVEPLTFGGICVFSNVCGCAGFVSDAIIAASSPNDGTRNVIIADYTSIDGRFPEITDLQAINRTIRDKVEADESRRVADEIIMLLPKTESEVAAMIENGRRIAQNMSWDVVVTDYLLPTLEKILLRRRSAVKDLANSRN
jgi:glycogen synthase